MTCNCNCDGEEPPEPTVTICHMPGTPAEKTMDVPISALQGHLGHGDTVGACAIKTVVQEPIITPVKVETPPDQVTVIIPEEPIVPESVKTPEPLADEKKSS